MKDENTAALDDYMYKQDRAEEAWEAGSAKRESDIKDMVFDLLQPDNIELVLEDSEFEILVANMVSSFNDGNEWQMPALELCKFLRDRAERMAREDIEGKWGNHE